MTGGAPIASDTPNTSDTPISVDTSDAVEQSVREFLDEALIEWEPGRRTGELVVTLPGEKKLKTVCSLVIGDQSLSISAFVVRNPDENHEAVYAYLLRRNLKLPGLAYAIDKSGDVYVTGARAAGSCERGIPRPDLRRRPGGCRRRIQRAPRDGLSGVDEEGVGLAELAR